MTVTPSNLTIADLCQQYKDGLVIVDRSYQRSLAWPPAARSFLIDTILAGYPLPKLSFAQTTDLKSRKTVKAIVDGQQRTLAILAFYTNDLRISTRASPFVGRKYNQLEDEDKQRFLAYPVSVDIFTGATDIEIREVFRRMNWYTAPLNPQEKRHASSAGEFKTFISHMAQEYGELLLLAGTYNKQQLSRMADELFLAECSYTYICGVDHASDAKLNKLYEEYDADFPQGNELQAAFRHAFERASQWQVIYGSDIAKAYNLYSLMTATMHVARPSAALAEFHTGRFLPDDQIESNLARMAGALEDPSDRRDMLPYVQACSKGTNRIPSRTTRLRYFISALCAVSFEAAAEASSADAS